MRAGAIALKISSGVELHGVALGGPLLGGPGEEIDALVEFGRVVLDAADDPRPVGVVFGDREAEPTGHERMFAHARPPTAGRPTMGGFGQNYDQKHCRKPLYGGRMDSLLTDPAFLTTAETAALLRVSPRTVCRYGAEGRLAVVHLTARSLRFPAASVQALMAGPSMHEGGGDGHPRTEH